MTVDKLWQAVVDRDAAVDGLFVYAVRSTRVYCRPSCASRKPRRDRVEFFPAPAMAEARGYRACKRCRPAAVTTGSSPAHQVRLACERIAREPDRTWSSATLARAAGTSVAGLQRRFRRLLGLSPRDYAAACRQRRFLDILKNGGAVTDAVYEAGFGSPSRVYGSGALRGMTPATYGRGGTGARITWAVTPTAIGRVLVAATERGLCFVAVGASQTALVRSLRDEFPGAGIADRPSSSLGSFTDAVRAVAAGQRWDSSLPLDIRGTAFQWRVWRALSRIPSGETRSYTQVARAIGQPSAARAVARGCATNPVALVVPCHRVVSATTGESGYRWGGGVKRRLLSAERR
jgi:AraC family transcriptional regulator of adaptative response/methylated-DNA-[protein]-cysteine methyltransferase